MKKALKENKTVKQVTDDDAEYMTREYLKDKFSNSSSEVSSILPKVKK